MAFWLGLNLPWLDYGGDFGKNAWQPDGGLAAFPSRRARLEGTFAALADKGWRVLRWFLLCDGRAGVRFSPRGDPQGLDDRVFADVDQGLSLASAHGLQVMFAVLDFHWFDKARTEGGVQLGGHAKTVSDARLRARLLDSVLAPLFTRYASEPTVWGWDLCNEPEWAVRRVSAGRASVTPATMRAFLSESAALAHGLVKQPVTVGLASVRGLDLVTGIGPRRLPGALVRLGRADRPARDTRRRPVARPAADPRRVPDEGLGAEAERDRGDRPAGGLVGGARLVGARAGPGDRLRGARRRPDRPARVAAAI